MKKFTGVIFAVCLALAVVGCASKPPATDASQAASLGGLPPAVVNARKNLPEDVLLGIGNAKMSTIAQSRNVAAARARAEISNSLSSMVSSMVRDYTASSEADPQAVVTFQENMTRTLSQSNLIGAVIVEEGSDETGMWWCIMHLSKANVVREISQAQAAARLAVPAMASFDAETRMNEAFEQARADGL